MAILVADTSVLIDLERSSLTGRAFASSYEFAVPDLLYETELKDNVGPDLLKLGLRVIESDSSETTEAQAFRLAHLEVSVPDAFAYSLALRRGWSLLAGDGALRHLAAAAGMDVHGVLWLMDQLLEQRVASPTELHRGLLTLSKHPRCRLPPREVQFRLAKYVDAEGR